MGECFFWYRPTRVVPYKRPLNGCVCVYTVLNGDIANDREFRQSPQITSVLYFGSSFIYAMTEARVFKF